MEVHLLEGELVCPETGRKFPVRQGVPNMLLHEDGEVYCSLVQQQGHSRVHTPFLPQGCAHATPSSIVEN